MTRFIIHKEGTTSVFIAVMFGFAAIYAAWVLLSAVWLSVFLTIVFGLLMLWVVFFFRVPRLVVKAQPGDVLSSADGKVVAVEQIDMEHFPGGKAWQVSVFMSPFNTHLNRFPVPGRIGSVSYEKGKFLPAYHPKSSDLNERNTVRMISDQGDVIWIRQIAGIMARRIVNYARKNQQVYAGEPLGFIKFGSRVDHFLPAYATVNVKIGQNVRAGKTILAVLLKD